MTTADFWRRWHISLSSWLREYLYIPLGGSRRGAATTVRNLMVTMVLGGLWHGAGWNFIVWGGLHGLYLGVGRIRQWAGLPSPATKLSPVVVFALVAFAWIFFRAASLTDALEVIRGIYAFVVRRPPAGDIAAVLLGLGLLFSLDWAELRVGHRVLDSPAFAGATVGVALCAVLIYSGTAAVPFIYFQF